MTSTDSKIQMLGQQSKAFEKARFTRKHSLSSEGRVLVDIGDKVFAENVLAISRIWQQHLLLDASQALGVKASEVEALLQREIGDKVEKGAIIAGKRKIGGRLLRAPEAGRIAAIDAGQILLQVSSHSEQLTARLPGIVKEIDPDRGAHIESLGLWLEGVWGNGGYGRGEIEMLFDSRREELSIKDVDVQQRGLILVAGFCSQAEVIQAANDAPIHGLILGSLSSHLIPLALRMSYPIMLTEGFGKHPMNQRAYAMLRQHSGKIAFLNAEFRKIANGQRPELLIQSEESEEIGGPPSSKEFAIGEDVHIVGGSQHGEVGKIAELFTNASLFSSGLRAAAALVVLEDESEVLIPLANLEILLSA